MLIPKRLELIQRCNSPATTAASAVQTMLTTAMNSAPHRNSVGSVTRLGIGAFIALLHMSSAQGLGAGCMWGIGISGKCVPG